MSYSRFGLLITGIGYIQRKLLIITVYFVRISNPEITLERAWFCVPPRPGIIC
mgnify:CR=1 FL=1